MVRPLIVAVLAACSVEPGAQPGGDTATLTPPVTTTPTLPPLELDGQVIPAPGEDGHDAALAEHVDAHDRVFGALVSGPTGLALAATLVDDSVVTDWVATGSGHDAASFQTQTGVSPDQAVEAWSDVGQQGFVGGLGAMAEVARYAVLRDDAGAAPADVAHAQAALERVFDTLHDMHTITGRPGTLARGIASEDLAGLEDVDPLDLFDDGDPQPRDKEPTWREDGSGDLDGMLWIDDAGKAEWVGYALALGAAVQVAADDPAFDTRVATARDDARVLGLALMDPSPHTGVDLTLVDADGRHPTHEDLNATQADGVDLGRVGNPYNALLSLALVRTLGSVSGDPTVLAFYDELSTDRGYGDVINELGSAVYYGYSTDYAEVAVGYAAVLSWLLHETDPGQQGVARLGLTRLWGADTSRATAEHLDPFATVITAAWVPVTDAELAVAMSHLHGFAAAPYLDVQTVNCDDAELATDTCVAVDGVTPVPIYGFWSGGTFEPEPAYGGVTVAMEALPQALRPASRFGWSADPYRVNGGGSGRLLSAADLRAAYWLGRLLPRAR